MKRISILIGSLGILSLLGFGTASALTDGNSLQPAASHVQTTRDGQSLQPAANTIQLTIDGSALQPAANLQ